jgi:hypothetical protein
MPKPIKGQVQQMPLTFAEVQLHKLAEVGVDSSLEHSDILDFLGNPDFTPYPAVGQALLNLLSPNGLRRPVFIDVVVANYEAIADSPRRVEDVDQGVLAEAFVQASNVRHGTEDADLASLLK